MLGRPPPGYIMISWQEQVKEKVRSQNEGQEARDGEIREAGLLSQSNSTLLGINPRVKVSRDLIAASNDLIT